VFYANVGGSVKTQLSKNRNLLVWRWRHVSAVLGHVQVISYLQLTIVKRKHIHRLTWRYCVFVVFNEISLLTGLCFICNWLRLYKYAKLVLNWKTSLKNWKTLTIGGVPGWILLCWSVVVADWMYWSWFWYWLWGRFFRVGRSCSVLDLLGFFGWSNMWGRSFLV
jgi:hypothetical protein